MFAWVCEYTTSHWIIHFNSVNSTVCELYCSLPWRRKWEPIPIFLPGKFHGQRSLVGFSPWGCKESDMTERLNNNNSNKIEPFCVWWRRAHVKLLPLLPPDKRKWGARPPQKWEWTGGLPHPRVPVCPIRSNRMCDYTLYLSQVWI